LRSSIFNTRPCFVRFRGRRFLLGLSLLLLLLLLLLFGFMLSPQ
jgi:hypothetical protein